MLDVNTRAHKSMTARAAGIPICVGLLLSLLTAPACAQEAVPCDDLLPQADSLYVEGQYELAIRAVDDCLQYGNLTRESTIAAYRLLALSYIRMDMLSDARMSVLHLLNEVPDYTPDPITDPPNYTVLVESVKSQFEPTEPVQESSWLTQNARWLIGGGVALAGSVLTAILLQGGGAGGGGDLPPPPGMPN